MARKRRHKKNKINNDTQKSVLNIDNENKQVENKENSEEDKNLYEKVVDIVEDAMSFANAEIEENNLSDDYIEELLNNSIIEDNDNEISTETETDKEILGENLVQGSDEYENKETVILENEQIDETADEIVKNSLIEEELETDLVGKEEIIEKVLKEEEKEEKTKYEELLELTKNIDKNKEFPSKVSTKSEYIDYLEKEFEEKEEKLKKINADISAALIASNVVEKDLHEEKKELEKYLNGDKYKEDILRQKTSFEKQIKDLTKILNDEISELKTNHKEEVSKLSENLNEEIERLNKKCFSDKLEYDESLATITKNHEVEILKLTPEYDDLYNIIKEKFDKEVKELRERFEKELYDAKEMYLKKFAFLDDEFHLKEDDLQKFYQDRVDGLNVNYDRKCKMLEDMQENRMQVVRIEHENNLRDIAEKEQALEEDHRREKQALFDERQKALMEINDKAVSAKIKQENDFRKLSEELEKKKIEVEKLVEKKIEEIALKERTFEEVKKEELQKVKAQELDLVTKQQELFDKVNEFNTDKQNFAKKQAKIIRRHSLIILLKRKFMKNLKVSLPITLVILLLICHFFNINEYRINPSSYISKSIKTYEKLEAGNADYTITLITDKSALKSFQDLDGLSIRINSAFNDRYKETYKDIAIDLNDTAYNWERFYKNDTEIIRSAFYGQYLINKNFKNTYPSESLKEDKIISNAIRKYLSKNNVFDYEENNRISVASNNSYGKYVFDNLIGTADYNYYFKVTNPDNELFTNIFKEFIDSTNYKSFIAEEKDIQTTLGYTDILKGTEDIFNNILKYGTVTETEVNVKMNEEEMVQSVDMLFTIDYKDHSMANPITLQIRVNGTFKESVAAASLEKEKFTKNSILLEDLRPTAETDENTNSFEELGSVPFTEESTTYKSLEEAEKAQQTSAGVTTNETSVPENTDTITNEAVIDVPDNTQESTEEEPLFEIPEVPEDENSSSNELQNVNEQASLIKNVNVRFDKDASSNVIGKLAIGSKVTRTGVTEDGWSKVEYNGKVGYIQSDALKIN